MEFFLFLLYNQENSREKYFPAKRGEINMKGTSCEYCANYTYDEECDEYYCDVNLDEDEYYRFVSSDYKECPYDRSDRKSTRLNSSHRCTSRMPSSA